MRLLELTCAAALVASCGASERALPASADDPLVNKVWTLAHGDGRPGVVRIFLADGVLIQGSCWEPYRLSNWRKTAADRLTWNEDGVDVEAEVVEASTGSLTIRLALGADERVEIYRALDAPFVCPDMPR